MAKHSDSEPVFATAKKFTRAANGYFAKCDEENKLYGEAGLCLYLSEHNESDRVVTTRMLRNWWRGDSCEYLKDAVDAAYMRIQAQIETDHTYMDKTMATRAIFLLKQPFFGGYQDKTETKTDTTVRIVHDDSVSAEDFK